jgi:hypothetical protein
MSVATTSALTSTSTTTPAVASTRSIRSVLTTGPVWRVGAVAAVAGAVVTELFALAARAIDIPMDAGSIGGDTAAEIPVGGFAMGVVMSTVIGTVLALALARWARRPARTFVATAVVLTAVSMAGPIGAGATATATQVVLGLSHLVAAAIVIPPLARRLAEVSRPGDDAV